MGDPMWNVAECKLIFEWNKVLDRSPTLQGLVKKEKNGKDSWKAYWLVLHRNYLIWYPPGKTGEPKDKEKPEGFVRLDLCAEIRICKQREYYGLMPKLLEMDTCFSVTPVAGYGPKEEKNGVFFRFDAPAEFKQWWDILEPLVKQTKEERVMLVKFGRGLTELHKVIKKPTRLPHELIDSTGAKNFVETMKQYQLMRQEWLPVLRAMKSFAEHYTDSNAAYIDWFTYSGGGGMAHEMQEAQDSVLSKLQQRFCDLKAMKADIIKFTETRFFREDLDDAVKYVTTQMELITYYNKYRAECQGQMQEQYLDLMAKLDAVLLYIGAFPHSKDINMNEGHSQARINVSNFIWEYRLNEENVFVLECTSHKEMPMFICNGFEIVSLEYGTMLWNGASFLWFHPQIPFTIRFNLLREQLMFARHPLMNPPKQGEHAVLPWWKLEGSAFVPMVPTDTDPDIWNHFATVRVEEGTAPVAVIALVAMMKHIKSCTLELLGY